MSLVTKRVVSFCELVYVSETGDTPLPIFQRDGDSPVEIVGRNRLDKAAARRMVIKEMIIMYSQGYSYREIAMKYRLSHTGVRKLILGVPEHVKDRLREVGLV